MQRRLIARRLLPQASLLLLLSTLTVAQVSQPKTQDQTNESETRLTADNIESMTFKPVDESRKRISVVIRMNKETREKKELPKTIAAGINGETVDFKSKRGGKYQTTVRLKGGEVLDNTETLELAHGSILTEHYLHSAGEMSLRCNTRRTPCDQNCRSAKSPSPCMFCMKTCDMEWENSPKK